jgi:hypothetical protein
MEAIESERITNGLELVYEEIDRPLRTISIMSDG